MIEFNKRYLILTILLLITEIVIGVYLHDSIIRPYGGDFLVVILIYCLAKSLFNTPVWATALSVLAFAYMVEISQYFNLVKLIGLQHSKIARIILGTSFSVIDLLTYTLGIMLVVIIDKLALKTN